MAKKYLVRLGDEVKEVEVEESPDRAGVRVRLNSGWHEVRLEQVGESSLYALVIDDRPHELFAVERAGGYDIIIGSERFPVAVEPEGRRRPTALTSPPGGQQLLEKPAAAGGWLVLSPMTGAVVEIYVKVGDAVATGDVLMVIEAMKMNNELRAQRAGTVRELFVSKAERLEPGSPLLLLE